MGISAKIEKVNGTESLVITLPISKGISKSGKSITIASTNGNIPLSVGNEVVTVGVNAYVKNPNYVPEPKTK